jgi:diaminopimelate decarboxylase
VVTDVQTASANPVAELLPDSAVVTAGGSIVVGDVPLAEIARRFGTPAYVLDVAAFRARAAAMRDGLARRWPRSQVLFASKSLPALAMYELAASERLSIDVAGDGELRLALAAGVDPGRLYFHGNAKTDAELRLAVEAGVGTVIVDNADELERLLGLPGADSPQDVLVRVRPDVVAPTHPSQETGGPTSKFGLPLDQALALMERIEGAPNLRLRGAHVHIGSQILDTAPFVEAVRRLAAVGDYDVYDIGGGLGVRYTLDETAPSIDDYLDAVTSAARGALPHSAMLVVEPGRSLVASAGLTLYRVVSVKHTGRTFVAVDGGMADNLDPALTGQRYEAILDGRAMEEADTTCTVVGRQCESGDTLIDDARLSTPAVGDLLVLLVTGAYSYTLANNYNGAYIPPLVFVESGQAYEASRRQTFDDILALQRRLSLG